MKVYLQLWVCLAFLIASCQSSKNEVTGEMPVTFPDTTQLTEVDGEQLAYIYCQLCHQFPEPSLLSKKVWQQGILPQMGYRLGIRKGGDPMRKVPMYDQLILSKKNIYPAEKKITEAQWDRLVQYYVNEAPEELPVSNSANYDSLSLFQPQPLRLQHNGPALTTMVWLDTTANNLWVANRSGQTFLLQASDMQVFDTVHTQSPLIAAQRRASHLDLLEIGIMNPSEEPKGQLSQAHHSLDSLSVKWQQLQRPVHMAVADLNSDGTEDYLISGFGNNVGDLSWYDSKTGQKHIIASDPGCIKTVIQDFNHDGQPDILALWAQGDERLSFYYNKGDGRFEEKVMMQFPPVYGSSDFELSDMNQDGFLDIVYINGDNADYSIELKPYHGVRIFENNGDNTFSESCFFPTYGATRAAIADYDQDGDQDIGLISYFADFTHAPQNGFLWLENQSHDQHYHFAASSTTVSSQGRWLTIESGDIDQDGDVDIILGSFIYGQVPNRDIQQKWLQSSPDILVLYNQLK